MHRAMFHAVVRGCGVIAITITALCCIGITVGCGGKQATGQNGAGASKNGGSEPVSAETLEEIKDFFDRKRAVVSKCFVSAWEQDEKAMGGKSTAYVTITLRILTRGRSKGARVVESSAQSEMLNTCVLGLVKQWTLPSVESAFDYSYSFSFAPF